MSPEQIAKIVWERHIGEQATHSSLGILTAVIKEAIELHKDNYREKSEYQAAIRSHEQLVGMSDEDQWVQDQALMQHYRKALQEIKDGAVDHIKIASDALANFLPEVE